MAVQQAGSNDMWAKFAALVPKDRLDVPAPAPEPVNPVDSVQASPAVGAPLTYQAPATPAFDPTRIDTAPSLDLHREVAAHVQMRQQESYLARQSAVQQQIDRYNMINGNYISSSPGMGMPFGQPPYGQPAYGQPGFVQPGQPGYLQPGQPGYVQPGYPNAGFVQPQTTYAGTPGTPPPTTLSW